MRVLLVTLALAATVAVGSFAPSVSDCSAMTSKLLFTYHTAVTPAEYAQCVRAELVGSH